jgi:hypothetical protein
MKEKSFFCMGSSRKPEKLHLKTKYWLRGEKCIPQNQLRLETNIAVAASVISSGKTE